MSWRLRSPRAVDAALVSVLLSASLGAAFRGYYTLSAVSALLSAVAAIASLRLSAWLRGKLSCSTSPGSDVAHVRKAGSALPCPFPDAWYAVALSAELPAGALRSVTVCSRNLVVWRPAQPAGAPPVIMSAYCPHMGAHLGLGGGSIIGGTIRCPFHGWTFDAAGACVAVPGCESGALPAATVPRLPVCERNGVISVWMASASHREGAEAAAAASAAGGAAAAPPQPTSPSSRAVQQLSYEDDAAGGAAAAPPQPTSPSSRAAQQLSYEDDAAGAGAAPRALPSLSPAWHIPEMPELTGAWTYVGYTENIVPAHLLEMPMNGADVAHLSALHSGFVVPWLGWALSHTWAATWTARTAAGERHLADIAIDEAVALFGVELPGKVRVKILQAGPSQVFLRMQTPVGPIFVIETVTPVSPLEQRTLHALYVPPWFPTVAGKAILAATLRQYEKDVPVWTSKVYKRQPMLSSADKAVASYLRWINQFSNPASITFEEAAKAHARDMAGLPSALAW